MLSLAYTSIARFLCIRGRFVTSARQLKRSNYRHHRPRHDSPGHGASRADMSGHRQGLAFCSISALMERHFTLRRLFRPARPPNFIDFDVGASGDIATACCPSLIATAGRAAPSARHALPSLTAYRVASISPIAPAGRTHRPMCIRCRW